jgi:hypothetical protein
LPIGIYFEGKYTGKTTYNTLINSVGLSIPSNGVNAQVIFGTNVVSSNISYNATFISNISFNVTDNTKDFSGTIYIGMLKLTNINLYTAPGYIYDMNVLTDMALTAGAVERKSLTVRYQFKYGLIYNYSYPDKKTAINCTIAQNASTETLIPIQLLESSSPT